MCNAKMLVLFLSLCQGYFNAPNPPTLTMEQCVKSLDICVDREIWEYEDLLVSNLSQEEKEKLALEHCDFILDGRREFSSYYTDMRCGYQF